MKTVKIGPYIVWITLLSLTLNTMAQVKEVPITTPLVAFLHFTDGAITNGRWVGLRETS